MFSLDATLLTNYYNARAGVTAAAGNAASTSGTSPTSQSNSPTGSEKAPRAPWTGGTDMLSGDALVSKVLSGQRFIKSSAITTDVAGASADYNKLFSLYQGLAALEGIAQKAQTGKLSTLAMAQAQRRFDAGMAEVTSFIEKTGYDHLNLIQGTLTEKLKSSVGVPRTDPSYVTANIHTGSATTSVKAFEGDVRFNISVKRTGTETPYSINIDLAEMGTTTRSMSNVVSFINAKLKDQGLQTKFEVNRTPATPLTTTVNGKTVTLSKGLDSYGLKIKGQSTEVLTFSTSVTADSVYVVQASGDADKKDLTTSKKDSATEPDPKVINQLIKFQTDISDGGTLADPISKVGNTYWVEDQSGQKALEETIKTVHATAAGPDGSLYVLADVEGKVSGQEIKGAQDVALIKYDSAGNIVFTRTLGASDSASGLALAVSADGKVAIAGSVTGSLNIGTTQTRTYTSGEYSATSTTTAVKSVNGVDSVTKDSFVTVLDAVGAEVWTQRRGAAAEDEATSVAFGADGSVYVGGKTKSPMPGSGVVQAGGFDSYMMGFSATGQPTFSTQSGTAATDATSQIVVNGNKIYSASIEDGNIVLRTYEPTATPAVKMVKDENGVEQPVNYIIHSANLTSTRTLGAIGGGAITGMAIQNGKLLIGGSTGNGTLMSTGDVSKAYSGGMDAFAASLNLDLANTADDTIAFYGGAGTERDAKVTFADGKAWISGMTTGEIDGTTKKASKDAYLARLNIETGAVEYQTRYTGKDGIVQPAAIAVSQGGSSVLDRLGLPQGKIEYKDDTRLTSASSLRTGDAFYVQAQGGVRKKIVIDANETLETLAKKINRASGYKLRAEVVKVLGKPESQLQLTPASKSSKVELVAGPAGQDALESLGISEGLITADAKKSMDAKAADYLRSQKAIGLNFDASLSLSSDSNIKAALESLAGTIKTVQRAYTYLKYGDPQEQTEKKNGKTGGTVPVYLTNQLANYQSALARLTGGA